MRRVVAGLICLAGCAPTLHRQAKPRVECYAAQTDILFGMPGVASELVLERTPVRRIGGGWRRALIIRRGEAPDSAHARWRAVGPDSVLVSVVDPFVSLSLSLRRDAGTLVGGRRLLTDAQREASSQVVLRSGCGDA